MKKIRILCLLLIAVSVATAQKKKEVTTPVTVNYCLPKVQFRVAVELECTRSIPGPFWQEAEKELGIRPEITAPGVRWRVTELQVRPEYVPDEQASYSVTASGEYTPVLLALSPEGFLAGVSSAPPRTPCETWCVTSVLPRVENEEAVDLAALRVYNPLKEVLDTNYTTQEIDGVEKQIWDPIVRYEKRTRHEVVREAAKEIFRIKAERAKWVSGEEELPGGSSLQAIIAECDRMEKEYLSLFLGKTETYSVKRTFSVEPLKTGEPAVIFRFSETEGIAEKKSINTLAYSLVVNHATVPASGIGGAVQAAVVYYRVPAVGEVSLVSTYGELQRFRAVIPQLGTIKTLPTDVIANEGWAVEFHPEYGSLKSVTKR